MKLELYFLFSFYGNYLGYIRKQQSSESKVVNAFDETVTKQHVIVLKFEPALAVRLEQFSCWTCLAKNVLALVLDLVVLSMTTRSEENICCASDEIAATRKLDFIDSRRYLY